MPIEEQLCCFFDLRLLNTPTVEQINEAILCAFVRVSKGCLLLERSWKEPDICKNSLQGQRRLV